MDLTEEKGEIVLKYIIIKQSQSSSYISTVRLSYKIQCIMLNVLVLYLHKLFFLSLLSRIQAMNFAPLTTRGHSHITDSHTVSYHPFRLHLPSFTAPSQLFHIISLHLFTIISSHTHYISPEHSATLCRVLLA